MGKEKPVNLKHIEPKRKKKKATDNSTGLCSFVQRKL